MLEVKFTRPDANFPSSERRHTSSMEASVICGSIIEPGMTSWHGRCIWVLSMYDCYSMKLPASLPHGWFNAGNLIELGTFGIHNLWAMGIRNDHHSLSTAQWSSDDQMKYCCSKTLFYIPSLIKEVKTNSSKFPLSIILQIATSARSCIVLYWMKMSPLTIFLLSLSLIVRYQSPNNTSYCGWGQQVLMQPKSMQLD